MKINPLAIFTTIAVVAAGGVGYVAMKLQAPKVVPVQVEVPVAPAPAAIAKVEPPTAPAPVPAPAKPEQQAAVTTPVQPAPAAPVAKAPDLNIVPSFDTVRVEKTGEAVIAGHATPGAEVTAKLNGVVVATAKANAEGSFVMIPDKPLAVGTGELSLESKDSGTVLASSQTVAVAVQPQGQTTIALVSPDAPTKLVQSPAIPPASVSLDAVDYDASGKANFSGRAKANAPIRLYVDNAIAGEVKADDQGKWLVPGSTPMAAGKHILRVDEISADGSVAMRVEQPFSREEPAKVAESTPAPVAGAAIVATKVAVPDVPQADHLTIKPGDNLWYLSRLKYGAGRQYTVIYEANKELIKNPSLIYPGQVLTAPAQAKTQ